MGRRPKSSHERELGGNAGHRALPNDPKPALGWPVRPRGLGIVARRQWKVLGTILDDEHRLTTSDGPALEGAALAYEAWQWALEQAKDCPLMLIGPKGEEKAHPAYGVVRSSLDAYRKWLNDLTMTPGTRARARVPHVSQDKNRLEELQAQGRKLRQVV